MWQNLIVTTRNQENNLFIKKFDGKMLNFKMLGRPWPPFWRPCP